MKLRFLLPLFAGLCLTFFVGSCTHDPIVGPTIPFCDTVSPTYTLDIKTIVDMSCAYSGCHASGAGIGDFTTYSGMQTRLDNGKIRARVIDMKDDSNVGMPPNYATNGPIDLSEAEIALFECWLNSNHPE